MATKFIYLLSLIYWFSSRKMFKLISQFINQIKIRRWKMLLVIQFNSIHDFLMEICSQRKFVYEINCVIALQLWCIVNVQLFHFVEVILSQFLKKKIKDCCNWILDYQLTMLKILIHSQMVKMMHSMEKATMHHRCGREPIVFSVQRSEKKKTKQKMNANRYHFINCQIVFIIFLLYFQSS